MTNIPEIDYGVACNMLRGGHSAVAEFWPRTGVPASCGRARDISASGARTSSLTAREAAFAGNEQVQNSALLLIHVLSNYMPALHEPVYR